MSRTMKIRKLKLFYFQKNARYRAKELCRNIFLGNLSLNEGKISVGLPVLILEFWWRHVKTKICSHLLENQLRYIYRWRCPSCCLETVQIQFVWRQRKGRLPGSNRLWDRLASEAICSCYATGEKWPGLVTIKEYTKKNKFCIAIQLRF